MTKPPFRWIAVAVTGVALAAAGATAYAGQTPGAGTPAADQSVVVAGQPIVFTVDGRERCLDIPSDRLSETTELQLWDCHGGENQTFVFGYETGSTDRASLRTAFGTCVTFADAGNRWETWRHSPVIQRPCDGSMPVWDQGFGCIMNSPDPTTGCDFTINLDRWYATAPLPGPQFGTPPLNMSVQGTDAGAPNGTRLEMNFHPNPGEDPRGLHFVTAGPGLFDVELVN